MTIANVTINNTFDDWRKTTNELIVFAYQTNDRMNAAYTASNSAYAAVNSAIATAANISTNLLIANDVVIGILTNTSNAIANAYIQNSDFVLVKTMSNTAYYQSNLAYDRSNSFLVSANNLGNTVNNLSNTVNTFTNNVAYSVANVLASNTTIVETVNATANLVISNLLANTSIGSVNDTANAAFDKANSAGIITISNSTPTLPNTGQLWWNSALGRLLIYYTDNDGSQWVEATPQMDYSFITDVANAALVTANASYSQSNVTFNRTNTVYALANAAFDRANLSNDVLFVTSAFDKANTAYDVGANAGNIAIIAYNLAANAGANVVIGNEITSSNTFYVTFSSVTANAVTQLNVASSKLTFNPATGTLSSTVFNSLSDAELKDNVQPITNALDIINSMSGVGFNWKETGNKSFGVIAQEIEKVVPELVSDINNTKTVNYDGIIAFLIEAIKELNKRLESKE